MERSSIIKQLMTHNATFVTNKESQDQQSLEKCLSNLFQVPTVDKEVVRNVEVKVQGDTFHAKEIRKVMIRVYKPMSFIQSDKPIYLPGQTGNTELIM